MIETLSYYIGNSLNPYLNLSIEEYLLDTVQPGQMILYLWQNERTVVIGKNQNAWKECRFQELEQDGGHLARRLPVEVPYSTIQGISTSPFLFLPKIMTFPVRCRSFWRRCAVLELTHRNPAVTTSPLMEKVSGNAFCQKGENSYHHGTLMLHVDTQKVAHYLNVSEKSCVPKVFLRFLPVYATSVILFLP